MGIEENTVTAAIRASCAFLNKCLELQQVIDTSMRNYKAFFRWLFVVIVRLLGEQTPSEIVKITQQELGNIAEFLYNFDNAQVDSGESIPDKPVKFNLERLGQYLEDQELTILPDDEDNPWHKFLKDNSCLLKDNDTIFSLIEFKKFSLVQQQKHLKNAISQVFDVSKKETEKYFSALFNIKCYEDKSNGKLSENLRICQAYFGSENSFMMAFIDCMNINDGIHYMSIKIKEKASCSVTAMKYTFSSILQGDKEPDDESISILDLQFYSAEYLSVLTKHPRIEENSIFIQVPIEIIQINAVEYALKPKQFFFNEKVIKKNISPLIDSGVVKVLDKMDGFRLAVSGGRKVAVVLSKTHRKVRVFEMEIDGDDEEDETLDTTTQSQSTNNDQSTTEKQDTSVSAATEVTF